MNGYKKSIEINSTLASIWSLLTVDLKEWWGSQDRPGDHLGCVFKVSWGEPWYQFEVVEYEPEKRLTWKCTDANQIIGGMEGVQKEWVGTLVIWDLEEKKNGLVHLKFEHLGLVLEIKCYDVCSSAWNDFIGSKLKHRAEQLNFQNALTNKT